MIAYALAVGGACFAVLMNITYIAYTIGGVSVLAPLLGRVRRGLIAVAVASATLGASITPAASTMAAGAIAILASIYAWRRQWLVPQPCVDASVTIHARLDDDAMVLILPDGNALPLDWIRSQRIICSGDYWVVHCRIARSLALFNRPAGAAPPRPTLPHATGFYIGEQTGEWDGVDGTPRAGARDLLRRSVVLSSCADWRRAYPSRLLLGPPAGARFRSTPTPTPRVAGARGIDGAMDWGVVEGGRWRPVGDDGHRLETPYDRGLEGVATAIGDAPTYYLSRWAARRRTIPGA
jgi:hypothetical protein